MRGAYDEVTVRFGMDAAGAEWGFYKCSGLLRFLLYCRRFCFRF